MLVFLSFDLQYSTLWSLYLGYGIFGGGPNLYIFMSKPFI